MRGAYRAGQRVDRDRAGLKGVSRSIAVWTCHALKADGGRGRKRARERMGRCEQESAVHGA